MTHKTTVFSTLDYYSQKYFEHVKKFLEETYGDKKISDTEIMNEISFQLSQNWNDMYEDLLDFFDDERVLATAKIGRWNGVFDGGKIGYFKEILADILDKQDDFEIFDEDGHFLITTYHHDGQNNFEIKILTEKAEEILDEYNDSDSEYFNYSERQLHELFMSDDSLTELPDYLESF